MPRIADLNNGHKMSLMKRRWVLGFAVMTIALLLLLAAVISNLEFEPGKPLPQGRTIERGVGGGLTSYDQLLTLLTLHAIRVAFILSLITIIISLFSPQHRRALLGAALAGLFIVAFVYLLINLLDLFPKQAADQPQRPLPLEGEALLPLKEGKAEIGAVRAPWWSSFVFIAGGLGALAFLWWRLTSHRLPKEEPLPKLAALAEEAAYEIRSGANLENVILRCYKEMSELLSSRVKQDKAMTAREFEKMLHQIGIKSKDIHRLTRLFEGVRYGGYRPGKGEEQEAIRCLETIAQKYGATIKTEAITKAEGA